MKQHLKSGLGAVVLLMGLAACGNDTATTARTQAYLGVAKSVVGSMRPGKRGGAHAVAPAPDMPALIRASLKATDGPIMIMTIEASKVTLPIGPVTTNGSVVTWKTADLRAFAFDRGVLAATRGYGDDLMSTQSGPSISLITARRTGRATRVNHYLGGLGHTAALTMTCDITRGEQLHMKVGEIDTMTTHMVETCSRDSLTVQNQYWVDAGGKILKSRQWIGQSLGYITTQQLRPL